MGGTAKVKTTGRFGARYGVSVKKRVLKIEAAQKAKHLCPECGFAKIKRIAPGIYLCKKCNAKFSGGAYIPETLTGNIVKKMITQRAFLPLAKELLEAREVPFTEEIEEAKPIARPEAVKAVRYEAISAEEKRKEKSKREERPRKKIGKVKFAVRKKPKKGAKEKGKKK